MEEGSFLQSQEGVTVDTLLECLETHSLIAGLSPTSSHFRGVCTVQFSMNPEKHLLVRLVLPDSAMDE